MSIHPRRYRRAAVVCALAGLLAAAGCRRDGESREPEASASAKRYPFHGIVRDVKNGGTDLTVEHDAIPGFMGAMTMVFPVRAPLEVRAAIAPGDEIDATLVAEESRYWIEGIRRRRSVPGSRRLIPTAPPAEPAPAGSVTPVPNNSVSIGQKVPDFELTDQTNHRVKLSSLRGEPVAVTFLYTRCPVATACPMTTAKFSRLSSILAQKGFGKLLVVTVDPEHDTPAVLADYGKKAGADPSRWKFLTGDPKAVADVASSFGVLYYPDHGQVVHGQAVAVVDPEGRLSSIYYGESWEPEHILRDLEKARKG
ncbi:MAG TPA: SCO family protein [Thermoanaerobaculia bacterium]|nr:SCO family protein [Thermoanaerobaculia bacterium]